jgi:Domain of unknown function (DUF4383)
MGYARPSVTDQRPLAQGLLGAGLVTFGVAGFFYNGDFTSNQAVHGELLGIFRVNGWHNLLHVAAGMTALAIGTRASAAALAVLFLGIAVWGFVLGSGGSILGIVPVNTADNLLHLGLGLAAAAMATA